MQKSDIEHDRKLYESKDGLKELLLKYQAAEFVAQAIGAKPSTVRERMRKFGMLRFPRPPKKKKA